MGRPCHERKRVCHADERVGRRMRRNSGNAGVGGAEGPQRPSSSGSRGLRAAETAGWNLSGSGNCGVGRDGERRGSQSKRGLSSVAGRGPLPRGHSAGTGSGRRSPRLRPRTSASGRDTRSRDTDESGGESRPMGRPEAPKASRRTGGTKDARQRKRRCDGDPGHPRGNRGRRAETAETTG